MDWTQFIKRLEQDIAKTFAIPKEYLSKNNAETATEAMIKQKGREYEN